MNENYFKISGLYFLMWFHWHRHIRQMPKLSYSETVTGNSLTLGAWRRIKLSCWFLIRKVDSKSDESYFT